MSIPSSSEAVATIARSSPALSRSRHPAATAARGCRDGAAPRPSPEPLSEVMRHPLGQPARVDENQRGAMLADQFRKPVVNLRPHLVLATGPSSSAGLRWRDPYRAGGRYGRWARGSLRKRATSSIGLHCCGKPDALRRDGRLRQRIQPRQRQRQVGAALIVGQAWISSTMMVARSAQHLARLPPPSAG